MIHEHILFANKLLTSNALLVTPENKKYEEAQNDLDQLLFCAMLPESTKAFFGLLLLYNNVYSH